MADLFIKFCIISFFGCFIECVWHAVLKRELRTKRMLLHLPMCPVYGFGAVLFTTFLDAFYDNFLLVFIYGSLLASAAELMYFSFYMVKYNVLIWNYSDKSCNVLGGICIQYSALWGILAVMYVYFAEPVMDYFIGGMSAYSKAVVSVFMGILIISDFKSTGELFENYTDGKIENLPDCFWYVSKNINKNEIFIKEL